MILFKKNPRMYGRIIKHMNNTSHQYRNTAGSISGWRKLAFCLFALTVATAAFGRSEFSSMVVFGDSLSDTGRLFRLTHGGFPPRVAYYDGRQSNGPVWVEYLADQLGLEHKLRNYAVVGAMTGPTTAIPAGNVKSDVYSGLEGTSLSGQLAMYLSRTGGKVDPEALYIVEGGANDLIRPMAALLMNPPATAAEFMQAVNQIATPTVVNVATIVGSLKMRGAKYIAVVNVPDLGRTPYLIGFGPMASATITMVVDMVNVSVDTQLDQMESPSGNKIARIDAFKFINTMADEPENFGFVNVTQQFMTVDLTTLKVTYASPNRCTASKWLFWDDVHPTTRGHHLLAQTAEVTLHETYPAVKLAHKDCDD